jgi:APA family basic amino acid/polyamine antiporter
MPDAPRPYRTWGYPVTPAIYLAAFAYALYSLFAAAPRESFAGLGLIAAGVPFFVYMNRRRLNALANAAAS